MPVTIQLSSLLRDYCGSSSELAIEAASVRAVLGELERLHPKLHRSVCDDTGAIRRHVNFFVNTHNIRDHGGLDTALKPGDVVTILQAVSGG
ncbi:MAG: MoaD family protein [Planctomycetes bacterium]|nr:MoaD family protein [Planctomycetota bacterium]